MAGREPFTPTDKQRGMVEALVGLGLPQEEVSLLIINPETAKHIDAKTLRKAFAYELRVGGAKVKAEIARTLFQMATEDKSVSAALFLAKAVVRHENGAQPYSDDLIAQAVRSALT